MPIATPYMEDAALSQAQAAQIPGAAQAGAASAGQAAQAGAASAGQAAQAAAASAGQAAQAGTAQIDLNALARGTATTSADQLASILNRGSPLMTMAATAGNQQSAARGLLNSSMGIQAAQNAVIANAAQLAMADANSLNNMSQFNASNANQALSTNAGALNQSNQFNAGATNQQNQFNASNQQQVNLSNQQATNQQNQFNAGNQQQVNLSNQQATNQQNQFNASNQQQVNLSNQQATNTVNNANAGFIQQANLQNAQQSNAMSTWNAGQQNEAALKTLDINSRETLANIEANYKTLMQTNSGATGMYEQMLKNLADIQGNKDMDAGTKATAIQNQLTYLRTGMSMLQNMSGIQGLITF